MLWSLAGKLGRSLVKSNALILHGQFYRVFKNMFAWGLFATKSAIVLISAVVGQAMRIPLTRVRRKWGANFSREKNGDKTGFWPGIGRQKNSSFRFGRYRVQPIAKFVSVCSF